MTMTEEKEIRTILFPETWKRHGGRLERVCAPIRDLSYIQAKDIYRSFHVGDGHIFFQHRGYGVYVVVCDKWEMYFWNKPIGSIVHGIPVEVPKTEPEILYRMHATKPRPVLHASYGGVGSNGHVVFAVIYPLLDSGAPHREAPHNS